MQPVQLADSHIRSMPARDEDCLSVYPIGTKTSEFQHSYLTGEMKGNANNNKKRSLRYGNLAFFGGKK